VYSSSGPKDKEAKMGTGIGLQTRWAGSDVAEREVMAEYS